MVTLTTLMRAGVSLSAVAVMIGLAFWYGMATFHPGPYWYGVLTPILGLLAYLAWPKRVI